MTSRNNSHALAWRAADENRFAAVDIVVIALIFAVIVFGRLYQISILLPLNPDEAQAAANALRLQTDMMTWRSVDGGSNGPLTFFALMWPLPFDMPITMQTTRLTAALLAAGSLDYYLPYSALARRLDHCNSTYNSSYHI